MYDNPFHGKKFRFLSSFGLIEGVCKGLIFTARPDPQANFQNKDKPLIRTVEPWGLVLYVETDDPRVRGTWIRTPDEAFEILHCL